MIKTEQILSDNFLSKAKALLISMTVALVVNAGVVALLDNITLSKPQNLPPQLAMDLPPSHIGPIDRPPAPVRPRLGSILTQYPVPLHVNLVPFPAPTNPGKIEHPLDHEHTDGSSCFICNAIWFNGTGM